MELEYERDLIEGFRCLVDTCLCQEETLESIVPDACPDILRIVDVCGQATLLSAQAEEGMAVANGVVRAVILYCPEGGEGLCRMEASVPFICRTEATGLTAAGTVLALPALRCAEARALNPRKVLLRVDLAVSITACQPTQLQMMSSIHGREDICQRQMHGEHDCLLAVQEKPFSVEEQIRIQGSQNGACQILSGLCTAQCTESKLIGSKLIFKGTVLTEFLVREENGSLFVWRESLPISQVLDVGDGGEACFSTVCIGVADLRWDSATGEDRTVSLSLDLLAQAKVYGRRPVTLLLDLYSTKQNVECTQEEIELHRMEEVPPRTQMVRDLLETPEPVRSLIDSRVALDPPVCSSQDGAPSITTQARVTVLYLDERGAVQCIRKSIQIQTPSPFEPDQMNCCRCSAVTDLYATAVAGGIEVRFTVEFLCQSIAVQRVNVVTAARFGEERRSDCRGPSVVLRLAATDECLWDLAKAHGTTMEAIRQANGLENDNLPFDRMLLIPNCR